MPEVTAPKLVPIQVATPYTGDPVRMFRQLAEPHGPQLLLESAEIDSRENLKSLLLTDAALEITCRGQEVTVTALTANGELILEWLSTALTDLTQQPGPVAHSLIFTCPSPAPDLSEQERLQAVSNLTPLRTLQQGLTTTSEHPFGVFLGGVFAYDLLATFEQLPEVPTAENTCPDYQFYLAETLLIIDHQRQQTELLAVLPEGPDFTRRHHQLSARVGELLARVSIPPTSQTDQQAGPARGTAADLNRVQAFPDQQTFGQQVRDLKAHIQAGDIFQVVPGRRFTLPCQDALAAYGQLKQSNPSPYMFFLRTPDYELLGASPESALKYTAKTNQVELYPIAGTRPRAKDEQGQIRPDQDSRIELALRNDQKELAEHMMLVDLARNDLARIARTGTRYVADLLKVDRYSHVMHLVSRVVAQLHPDLDALHAYQACMNMGTLVGAPKISAARLIRHTEQVRRGSYGGAVGYLTGNGDMDTCIVIRSAFVRQGQAVVQAGAGVVHDSEPAAETAETEQKASAVIQAIQTVEDTP